VWELDDPEVKEKIAYFARRPDLVVWSRSAERDIANTPGVTHTGVLDGILDHLECGYRVDAGHMKNGDLAFILHCFVGPGCLYVKVKFIFLGSEERMRVFAAHENR
jgi:hypothetical protein